MILVPLINVSKILHPTFTGINITLIEHPIKYYLHSFNKLGYTFSFHINSGLLDPKICILSSYRFFFD